MKTITAPGSKNLITDVSGVQVGHAEDYKIGTGVTVITGDNPFSAAVDVRGGGPGTRETDMLSLENSIGRADAIVLSGGSAYGLDASSEIQDLLRDDRKGYQLGKAIIPLVPSAVIFDLNINDNPHVNKLGHRSPWRNLANQAYKSCSNNFLLGSYGAGCGATTATLKGGQGSSSWKQKYSNGQEYTVGAIVINNAVGNPLLNKGPSFLSGYLEINIMVTQPPHDCPAKNIWFFGTPNSANFLTKSKLALTLLSNLVIPLYGKSNFFFQSLFQSSPAK